MKYLRLPERTTRPDKALVPLSNLESLLPLGDGKAEETRLLLREEWLGKLADIATVADGCVEDVTDLLETEKDILDSVEDEELEVVANISREEDELCAAHEGTLAQYVATGSAEEVKALFKEEQLDKLVDIVAVAESSEKDAADLVETEEGMLDNAEGEELEEVVDKS